MHLARITPITYVRNDLSINNRWSHGTKWYHHIISDDCVYATSQWETTLQCSTVSHWLVERAKQSLYHCIWLCNNTLSVVTWLAVVGIIQMGLLQYPSFWYLIDSIFVYTDGNEQVITYEFNIDWTFQTYLWEVKIYIGPVREISEITNDMVSHIMPLFHYSDVIMGTMASQITSLTIVYSKVYSRADQRKHQRSASLAVTGEFPAQMPSNAESVSIWWRHDVQIFQILPLLPYTQLWLQLKHMS